jgi:hypothetical protein
MAEIEHRLVLTLDPDQEDLIRMILGQYHADRGRLRDLEDPNFDDDEEGRRYERPRLRAMAEGLRSRAVRRDPSMSSPRSGGSRTRPRTH